jgi:hypothetical protein
MAVKIGHARSDENNKARDGKAGDQTSKEVTIQNWYNRNWTAVFRAKDNKTAEKIAKTTEHICNNDNIGYDQSQRTTLYEYAEKCNWDIQKITEKCECDCSSLVAVCVNAAGVKISKNMYTGNQKAVLSATGKFEIVTDSKYLKKSDYLKRGDILLAPGHTAIVLSDGAEAGIVPDNFENKIIDSAKSFSNSFIGTYKVSASALNVRTGAGMLKKVITTIPKGTKVKCYGYFTKVHSAAWLYIQFSHNGKKYTGFASAKYLAK